MAQLALTDAVMAGIDPAVYLTAAASGGDQFVNNGRSLFHVKNAGGSTCNVTIGAVVDATCAITAGNEKIIGPFKAADYNDATGNVLITYDQVASVTVGVIAV